MQRVTSRRFLGYEIRNRVTYSLFGDVPIITHMLIEKYEVDIEEDLMYGNGLPVEYTELREKVVGASLDLGVVQTQMDILVLNSKGEQACK